MSNNAHNMMALMFDLRYKGHSCVHECLVEKEPWKFCMNTTNNV